MWKQSIDETVRERLRDDLESKVVQVCGWALAQQEREEQKNMFEEDTNMAYEREDLTAEDVFNDNAANNEHPAADSYKLDAFLMPILEQNLAAGRAQTMAVSAHEEALPDERGLYAERKPGCLAVRERRG